MTVWSHWCPYHTDTRHTLLDDCRDCGARRPSPEPAILPIDEAAASQERQIKRHLAALRRRQQFLIDKGETRNDFDRGELSALTWVFEVIAGNSPLIAHLVKKG